MCLTFALLLAFRYLLSLIKADNVIQIGCISVDGIPEDAVLFGVDYQDGTDLTRANQCGPLYGDPSLHVGLACATYDFADWVPGLPSKWDCTCSSGITAPIAACDPFTNYVFRHSPGTIVSPPNPSQWARRASEKSTKRWSNDGRTRVT
ncbi:hypothetical protein JCM24511_07871 [Saitozyma sp. JCM 24511]|nr:hypothetical protein JCM24511_07871 [Saitozyma sp. JCM 24511]